MPCNELKALIFDMDGVLVDSEPWHLKAYQEILAKFGLNYTAEENREFLGKKDYVILQVLKARYKLEPTPEELLFEKISILDRLLRQQTEPRPGVMTILERAHQMRIPTGVASSATLPTINLVVETLGIRSFFRTLTSGDEVLNGKPAPDVFLLAAERLGVAPEECLVVEDTTNGVLAAKAAGMTCVAIPCETTMHQDHSAADLVLTSLEHLDLSEWFCLPALV